MSLFQQSVLKKYLHDLDKDILQQRWTAFTSHFHNPAIQQNILNAKEEEYQEGFVRDLFVTVLGYTLNPQPDYNFVLEKKTEADSTKSDGAIISSPLGGSQREGTKFGGGAVIAVIELKDTATTDLDKVEKQAFGYKHRHRDCTYIITSNFQKLRFYINDAIDYEEFDLFTLTQEQFAVLYLCLQQQHIFKNIPLLIKQASLTQEENVTKQLYADYSGFRKKLFYNIVALNPQYNKIELFQKTQKLLDRFLFILFAEDRMLVPPNSVREILKQWQQLKDMDAEVPLYDRFKKYFNYLNTGHQGKQHEIFAYNGGLFAADEMLDNVKIDDTILYDSSMALSNYDFQTEIDVNILGHIFEHSLTELEELSKGLQPLVTSPQPLVTSPQPLAIGKRKKDGIFYTPRYITKYIVANTVGTLCEQKKIELQLIEEDYAPQRKKKNEKQLLDKLKAYRAWLLKLTICDPACGSGAFLNQALEFLIAEHRHIDELDAKLGGYPLVFSDVEKSILENNLFGVDINEEAVEIARLSLWLRTAQKGRKLNDLNKHIQCGNSLIDDPAVAGDKAFNWQKAFPEIFPVKEKQPFHITFVTHYSRRGERMDKYRVPHKEGFWMNEEAELLITEYIRDVVIENNFKVLAYNICGDHVHMMIVAEETELPEIMRKIKGKTSQRFKEHLQIDKEEEFHLWAQKYSTTWLDTREHYNNAFAYIENNRDKHELPMNKGLQPLVTSMLSTEKAAYAVEYKGGFDVVIGNPPYGAKFTKEEIDFFRKEYKVVIGHSEAYYLFVERSYKILKKDAQFGFIIPNAWFSNKYAFGMRKFILNHFQIELLINFNQKTIFEQADVETSICIANKTDKISFICRVGSDIGDEFIYNYEKWTLNDKNIISFSSNKVINSIFSKFQDTKLKLENVLDISNGIKPYQAGYGVNLKNTPLAKEDVENKIYHNKVKLDNSYKKEIKGKGVKRYSFEWEESYIKWGSWLMSPKAMKYHESPKILVRQIISDYFFATIDYDKYYADQSLYICINYPDDKENNLLYYLALINSKLYGFFFRKFYSEEDDLFPKIKVNELKTLPILKISVDQQNILSAKADIMLATNKELQEIKQQLLQLLQSNFPAVQFSKKLEQWPSLSFADFLKELTKQKIKPGLPQQNEWMNYFEEQKTKALALQTIIETTDKEIDAMVYTLYGLTAEEIQIVEGA